MSIVDHTQSFQVEYSLENTFKAFSEALNKYLPSFKLERVDRTSNTFYVKAGVSLFSWGENITINLKSISSGTEVFVLSTPKTGVMFGGALDMGKNRKNIDQISQALSKALQNYQKFIKESNNISDVDQLEKYAVLLEKGIINQNEFDKKKKEILGF